MFEPLKLYCILAQPELKASRELIGLEGLSSVVVILNLFCFCYMYFLMCQTEFVLFLAVLENSVLPMGAMLKSDVRTLNFRSEAIFAPR